MQPLTLPRRRLLHSLAALGVGFALATGSLAAHAQAWPAKPIRLIVGFPPGGTADVIARQLAEGLRQELGQPVVVDNKPGVAGALAAGEMVNAPHDGYTALVAVSGLVSEVPHFAKVRFDPFEDIKPLAELAAGGLVLVGSSDMPAANLAELVRLLKSRGAKGSFASYSPGTISHTLGLQLGQAAGLDLVHVPYRGSPPALTDVMSGQVQMMFDGTATSIPHIRGGKLRAYAVTAPNRLAALPDVPTMAELGYPQLTDVIWMGLWLSQNVPAPIQARLRAATLKVMSHPAVKAKLVELGLNPGSASTPEELSAGLRKASGKQGAILRSVGISPRD